MEMQSLRPEVLPTSECLTDNQPYHSRREPKQGYHLFGEGLGSESLKITHHRHLSSFGAIIFVISKTLGHDLIVCESSPQKNGHFAVLR